ncbi:MAG: TlpA disulfide reductase family protein [Acidobacteriota bacterium]
MLRFWLPLLSLTCFSLLAACAAPSPSPAPLPDLVGDWRAVLASPGGELPFTLRVRQEGDGLTAVAVNGREEAPFSAVAVDGRQVEFAIDVYDAEISAQVSEDGSSLTGRWRKTIPDGDSTLPFAATRDDVRRFLPLAEAGLAPGAAEAPGAESVAGTWAVEFREVPVDPESAAEPARAEFNQSGDTVRGTFLTPTGDYRYLAGTYQEGLLRLSTFDGAHAFLFEARVLEDGTLAGEFWSRDSYHARWSAERSDDVALPDAWSQVGLTNDDGTLEFTFPNLAGDPVSLSDERFVGKVVLVNVFGTWCPNCNDEAPLLAQWHREYRRQGFEVVGLAYEFSGDPERDGEQVRRFAERYGIEYPLLLAGISDKAAAGETLPDLTAVLSYPTTIFIGRNGKVRRIHSGFTGPGTGEHFDELIAEQTALIEELLAEETS